MKNSGGMWNRRASLPRINRGLAAVLTLLIPVASGFLQQSVGSSLSICISAALAAFLITADRSPMWLLSLPLSYGAAFLVTGDPAVLDQIRKELSKQFHSYLSVYCSDPFFVEVMPAGIDKAHSLLKLLTSIGLTTEQMICCGDGYNDLTMIETAGLGVAMANAQPAVRETADYITKSNDEDGVLHVINEFMR